MASMGINFAQNGEALGRFSVAVLLQVFGKNLFYLFFGINR